MNREMLIQMFKQKFKPNFMTPNVVKFVTSGNRVIEVSEGRGIDNEKIFGVTVRDYVKGKWKDPNISRMYFNKKAALTRAANLAWKNSEKLKEVV